jgi:hypothetical protein
MRSAQLAELYGRPGPANLRRRPPEGVPVVLAVPRTRAPTANTTLPVSPTRAVRATQPASLANTRAGRVQQPTEKGHELSAADGCSPPSDPPWAARLSGQTGPRQRPLERDHGQLVERVTPMDGERDGPLSNGHVVRPVERRRSGSP